MCGWTCRHEPVSQTTRIPAPAQVFNLPHHMHLWSRHIETGAEAVGAADRPQEFWDSLVLELGLTCEQVRVRRPDLLKRGLPRTTAFLNKARENALSEPPHPARPPSPFLLFAFAHERAAGLPAAAIATLQCTHAHSSGTRSDGAGWTACCT